MHSTPSPSFRLSIVNTKILALAATLLALCTATSAHAANGTWGQSAAGATFAWDATSNWGSGVIPGATGAYSADTDTATFGTLSGIETVVIDSSRNVENIAITNNSAFGYIFSGGPLFLTGGGSIVSNGTTGNATFSPTVMNLEGNYLISNSSTGFIIISNSIVENVSGTLTLAATDGVAVNTGTTILNPYATSTSTNDILATITQATGKVLNLTVNGNGVTTASWTLASGSNNFTGTTTIDGAVLNAASLANEGANSAIGQGSGTLNSTSDLVINGGELQYAGFNGSSSGRVNNTNSTGLFTNRLFTIGDSSSTLNTADIDSSDPFAATYGSAYNTVNFTNTGAIAFGGTAGNHTLTLSGINVGNNTFDPEIADQNTGSGQITNLVKNGPGTWILGNTNTYTGTTTINGGGILGDLTGQGVSTASVMTITNGIYQSSGNISRLLGTGTNVFTNTGTTSVSLDSNQVAGGNSLTIGDVAITGGRSGFSAYNNTPNSVITLNLTTPGGTPGVVQFGSTNFSPTEYVLNAQTANSTINAVNNYDLNGANRTIETDANTAIISGNIFNSSTNTVGLNKAGNGMLELTGVNTYTGLTGVSGGVLWATGSASGVGALGTNAGVINVGGGGELRVDSLSDIPGSVLLNHGTLGVTFNATQTGLGLILNSNSAGILALDALQSNALNMAALGNGALYLGSSTVGTYSASTLGVEGGGTEPDSGGAPNQIATFGGTYRLGGGGGTLTLTGQNVLTNQPASLLLNNYTNTTPSQSLLTSNNYNSVVIGDGSTAGQPNGGGTVDLQNTQNYLGTTTINAGATLNLDYSGGLASVSTAGNVNIISQYSPVIMQGGTLGVIGGSGSSDTQTLGGVTSNLGANTINVNSTGATNVTLNLGALTSNNYATTAFSETGTTATITTTTAAVNGGLSAAYTYNNNGTYEWVGETANTSGSNTLYAITPTSGASGTAEITMAASQGATTPTADYLMTASVTLSVADTVNLLRVSTGATATPTFTATTGKLTTNGIIYDGTGNLVLAGTTGITSNSGNLYIYDDAPNATVANFLSTTNSNTQFNGPGSVSITTPITGTLNLILTNGFFNLGTAPVFSGNVVLNNAGMDLNGGTLASVTNGDLIINAGSSLFNTVSNSGITVALNQILNGNFMLGVENVGNGGDGAVSFTGTVNLTNNITINLNNSALNDTNGLGNGSNGFNWSYSGIVTDGGFGYGLTVGANSPATTNPNSAGFGDNMNGPLRLAGTGNFTGPITILGDSILFSTTGATNRFNVLQMAANTGAFFGASESLAGLQDVGAPSNTEIIAGTGTVTLTLFGNGNYSFGGSIQDTGTYSATGSAGATKTSLVMDGAGGTQTLTGTNSFTGGITVNAGTLIVDGSQGGSVASQGLTLAGGAYEFIGANTGSSATETFTSTTVSGTGQSKIVAAGSGTTTLNLGTLAAATTGSVVDIAPSNANASITTSTGLTNGVYGIGTVVYTNPTTGVTTWASANTSGSSPFTIVAYTGDNTALPTTGVSNATNYNLTGSLTESSSTDLYLLRISNSSAGTLTMGSAATLEFQGDGLLYNGTAAYTITGGALTAFNSANQLIIQNYAGTGGSLTIASTIGNRTTAGGSALVLAGTGTTILTGTNTYSGATYFDGGTTNFNSLANFQNTPSYTFAGGTLQYATGNTADFTKTAAGATSVINIAIAGGTIDTNGNAVTWSKSFGNSGTTGGGLNFTDSFNAANPTAATGSVTIGGNITYSGLTTVSSGGVINLVGNNVGGGTIVGNGGMLEGGTTQITSSTQSTGASDAGKLTLMAGGVIAPGSPGIGTTVNNGSNGGIQAAGHGGIAGGNNAGDQNANVGSNVLEASQLQWYAGGTLTFYLDSTTTASSAAAPAASTVLNLGTGALAKMGGTGQYILNFAGTGGWNTNGSPNVYDLINFGLPNVNNNFNVNGDTDFNVDDFTIENLNGIGVLSFYDNTSANGSTGQEELILTVIPEPSTWAMLIGGLATLIFWTRRKRVARSIIRK